MNEWERAIGEQVREFREKTGLSMARFAEHLGITKAQLSNIESGHTPLRYSVAWKMRDVFGVSIDWLCGGDGLPNDLSEDSPFPLPNSPKYPKNTLLTEVIKSVYAKDEQDAKDFRARRGSRVEAKIDADEAKHRWLILEWLQSEMFLAVSQLPDGYTRPFADEIHSLINELLKRLPKEDKAMAEARCQALLWEKIKAEVAKRSLLPIQFEESGLTSIHASVKSESVKPLWPILKERLQKATAEPGTKTKLAEYLGVKIASVSQWLTESKTSAREPGAETALRMLKWVELQERK